MVAGSCKAIAAFQLRELHVVEAIHAALRRAENTAVQAAASKALTSLGQDCLKVSKVRRREEEGGGRLHVVVVLRS